MAKYVYNLLKVLGFFAFRFVFVTKSHHRLQFFELFSKVEAALDAVIAQTLRPSETLRLLRLLPL